MNKQLFAKLRRATVPSSCWTAESVEHGIFNMGDWVDNLRDRRATFEQVPNIYIRTKKSANLKHAAMQAQLYARQAVVKLGVQGRYMSFDSLAQHLEWPPVTPMYDQAISPRCSPHEVHGSGFLAITGLPLEHDTERMPSHSYYRAIAFLHEHVCEGGLLIATGLFSSEGYAPGAEELMALITATAAISEV